MSQLPASPRLGRRRAGVLALLVTLFACAHASAATIYPSFAPAALTGPPPWTTTYSIEIDTGAVPEHLDLTGPGSMTLDGPGTLSQGPSQSASSIRSCPDGRGSTVPFATSYVYYHLDLPAQSVNVLRVQIIQNEPLAIGERLGYAFGIGRTTANWVFGDPPTITESIDVGEPDFNAPRSIPLALAAQAGAPGASLPLTGRTTPQLAGQLMELRYTSSWPAFWQRVVRVRVQPDGSFAYRRWRPPGPGLYSFSALYRSHDQRFLSRSGPAGCAPSVQVGG